MNMISACEGSLHALLGAAKRAVPFAALLLLASLTAGCSAPAQTEAPVAAAPPIGATAQPFVPDAGVAFETPYYMIDLPESWAGTTTFSYSNDYSMPGPGLGLGYSTGVLSNDTGMALFSVTCFTDAWGPQGTFYATSAGSTPLLEGNYVSVYSAMFDPQQSRLSDHTEEYASYVSVKRGAVADAERALELPYYSFDLTAPEAANWQFSYDGTHRIEGDKGVGYALNVSDRTTGEPLFYVVCATEGFGPNAEDERAVAVGSPSTWSKAQVYVAQQRFDADGEAPLLDLEAYARYVAVK